MTLNELKEVLKTNPHIFIVTHKSPDGDAMGSSLGLSGALKSAGCTVDVVAPTEYSSFLAWMKGNEDVLVWGEHNEGIKYSVNKADLIFCLDFNALHRIDEVGDLVAAAKGKKVMIDHHQQPDNFADLTISNTGASSTAEMVYTFLEEIGLDHHIDADLGEALYCGIMTDTGSFRFPSTTQTTHDVAGKIIAKGANHAMVHRRIYDSNTETRLRVIGHCLSTMEVVPEHNVTIIKLSKQEYLDFNIQKGDTEGIVNYGLSMPEIKCSVFFKEDKGIIKISFRSKDDIDVNAFARKYFSGGGHVNAAGGMSNKSLKEAIEEFKSHLHEL